MYRRTPTRIELKNEDLEEFTALKRELEAKKIEVPTPENESITQEMLDMQSQEMKNVIYPWLRKDPKSHKQAQ